MTEQNIIKMIKEVGFPIVAFFAMLYLCMITIEQNTQAINNLSNILLSILG